MPARGSTYRRRVKVLQVGYAVLYHSCIYFSILHGSYYLFIILFISGKIIMKFILEFHLMKDLNYDWLSKLKKIMALVKNFTINGAFSSLSSQLTMQWNAWVCFVLTKGRIHTVIFQKLILMERVLSNIVFKAF